MLDVWSGCAGGALDVATYKRLLEEAGFRDVEVQLASSLELASAACESDGRRPGSDCCGSLKEAVSGGPGKAVPVRSAFIRARKPGLWSPGPQALAVEGASAADLPAILALLKAAGLPTEGVAEHVDGFLVARRRLPGPLAAAADGSETTPVFTVVGCAGVERYGSQALLRSVVVTAPLRGAGVGRRLVEAALARARSAGADEVYLLTATAEGYFRRFGFQRVDRQAVAGPVTGSLEFATVCPDTAAVMRLRLAQTG